MIRLHDSDWERIRHHFPEENISEGRPGRKPVPSRKILEATLWILNTGAQWHMLPQCYPNYKTVHRRFQTWCQSEVLRRVLTDIANELRALGVLDEEESFIDATFAMAKGGGADVGPTKRGKGLNHGDCGSSWFAALGQYACSEPPRSTLGSIVLRFLHDRSQARKPDWRSCLRQRSVGCGITSRRHRDDRAAPIQSQQTCHTRWTPAEAIRKAVG